MIRIEIEIWFWFSCFIIFADQGRNQAVKNSKNSNEESGLKKVGESCGEGYGKLGWENCGKCAHGLECEKNTFVVQKCMTCKLKSGKMLD